MTTENLRTLALQSRLRSRGEGGMAVMLVVLGWIGVIGLVAIAVVAPVAVAGVWLLTQAMGR